VGKLLSIPLEIGHVFVYEYTNAHTLYCLFIGTYKLADTHVECNMGHHFLFNIDAAQEWYIFDVESIKLRQWRGIRNRSRFSSSFISL
jgi:hypothetical protein